MPKALSITCLGDVAPVKAARDHMVRDPAAVRARFDKLFAGSDLVFANLEAPITAAAVPREDKKFVFQTSADVLAAFPGKFVFSIANNHIMDYGEEGLRDTQDHLTRAGLRFTGAGRNLAEAGRPVIVETDGRTVGFLACADRRYQSATETTPGVFPAVVDVLTPSVRRLRETADFVYVSIHMGMEYVPVPTPVMMRLAEACRRAGAHVVVFHHAHCVSGYTVFDDGAIVWGAGNYLFPESPHYPFKPWFDAAAWTVIHGDDTGLLQLAIAPSGIDADGMPRDVDERRAAKILGRIERLTRTINGGHSMGWLRMRHIVKPSYVRVAGANYWDIARRRGVAHMARLVVSSVRDLFLKRG
jgi:poly-gamma-glutamate capsule biosynthesis protein CapA/YwtB (metallophosphatase superfamily)